MDCPDGWEPFGAYCYHVKKHFKSTGVFGASQYCHEVGGELVSIHSAEENEFVNNLHKSYLPQSEWFRGHWIGYSDQGRAKNDFEWKDGSWRDYSNWKKGEPNDANDEEHCTMVMIDSGKWNDVGCDYIFGYKYFTCKGKLFILTSQYSTSNLLQIHTAYSCS